MDISSGIGSIMISLDKLRANIQNAFTFERKLVWRNILGIFGLHFVSIFSIYYYAHTTKFWTWPFGWVLGWYSGMSVTVGAHRLWTHKTYKAVLPVRIALMVGYLCAGQYSIQQWARDHRLHHKCSDTTADPHNANRGFFFSHCGWLMMKRHPDVLKMGKLIDVSDLLEDPVVRFQQKYFVPLLILCVHLLPGLFVYFVIGDNFYVSFVGLFVLRYTAILHIIWSVNSVTHLFGYKPYKTNIMAVQNKANAFVTMGEGWHNYHHVFPWDYRIGEYGQGWQHGAIVIEILQFLGLAYDLKTVSPEMIKRVTDRVAAEPGYEPTEEEIQVGKFRETKTKAA